MYGILGTGCERPALRGRGTEEVRDLAQHDPWGFDGISLRQLVAKRGETYLAKRKDAWLTG